MWQRFTERARKVVFHAQEEAGKLGEYYVSTEHLLLGMMRLEKCAAITMLSSLGITLEAVRTAVEARLGEETTSPSSQKQDMQLTPRAKRVIDLAYDEAHLLNQDYIGTEHLLLGLRREDQGVAAKALADLGVELEQLRAALGELLPSKSTTPKKDVPDTEEFIGKPRWHLYTKRARQTVFLAQEEASLKGVNIVSPDHFLGALLRQQDTLAFQALTRLGFPIQQITGQLDASTPRGNEAWLGPNMRLSPDAQRLVARAFEEAQGLNHDDIRPEHLLLGLIAVGQSFGATLLASHGVDLERAREAVRQLNQEKKE